MSEASASSYTIGGMYVTWISMCCGHLCSSIISVDDFMAVDIGSLRGAETTLIVIAKFTRLEAEVAMAKNNEMEACAMIADLLHSERVAKRSDENVRDSLRMANA
ncbi:hypothetical protein SO802_026324 [Lithocarpus litseifolius]|uniref:Uncharacterized protein n=1 Tax=Lithocarpus litseifolius TaxID=425828 RepID=A0AAW2C2X7_9ROSI